MKNFIKKHIEKLAIITTIATILAITLFLPAFVFYKMKQNDLKQEKIDKALHETNTKLDYDQCIAEASRDYLLNWNGQCEARGLEEDCMLPTSLAVDVDDSLDMAKEMCLELYKLQLTK